MAAAGVGLLELLLLELDDFLIAVHGFFEESDFLGGLFALGEFFACGVISRSEMSTILVILADVAALRVPAHLDFGLNDIGKLVFGEGGEFHAAAEGDLDVLGLAGPLDGEADGVARLLVEGGDGGLVDGADADAVGGGDVVADLDAGFGGWSTGDDAADDDTATLFTVKRRRDAAA